MKRDLVIGLIAVAAVVAAGLTALEWRGVGPAPAPQPNAAAPPPSPPAAAGSAATAPSFDVVRVNPQGDAVIAGRAAPGAEVSVLDGDRELGRVTANGNGEWVLVPKDPLPPGSHELSLSARSPSDGTTRKSEGVVAMLVPQHAPGAGGQPSDSVAVLVPGGGAPTRALQLPSDAAGRRKFAVDIIEYDAAGKVQMLGRAEPNAKIAIYLNDHPAGRGEADAAGTWSITLDRGVPVGHYQLRLEAHGEKGGAARLALTFDRIAPPAGFAAVNVQPGNSLWRIAERSFGEGPRYAEIYQANRTQIRDPNLIYPGQVFALPTAR